MNYRPRGNCDIAITLKAISLGTDANDLADTYGDKFTKFEPNRSKIDYEDCTKPWKNTKTYFTPNAPYQNDINLYQKHIFGQIFNDTDKQKKLCLVHESRRKWVLRIKLQDG